MARVAYYCVLGWIVVATGTIIDLPGALGSLIRVVAIPALAMISLILCMRGGFRKFHPYHVRLAILLFWMGISGLWSISPVDTVVGFERYIPPLLLTLAIWETCRTREQSDGALQAFVLGGYLLILSLAYSYITGAQSADADRVGAGGFNPDDFLYFIPVPIAWYLARRTTNHWFVTLLNIGYVCLAPLGCVFTAGRGALLSALPIYLYVLWSGRTTKTSWKAAFGCGIIVLIGLLAFLNVGSKLQRLGSTTNPGSGSFAGPLNGRDLLWKIALKQFVQHPILGIGSSSFYEVSGQSPDISTYRGTSGLPAHNTYLSILTETGVIGGALFALLLVIVFRSIRTADRERQNAFLAGIVGMMVGVAFLTYEEHIGMWLLFALVVDSAAASDAPAWQRNIFEMRRSTPLLPGDRAELNLP